MILGFILAPCGEELETQVPPCVVLLAALKVFPLSLDFVSYYFDVLWCPSDPPPSSSLVPASRMFLTSVWPPWLSLLAS